MGDLRFCAQTPQTNTQMRIKRVGIPCGVLPHKEKFPIGILASSGGNLNNHLTESIETVQKMALKCIYPANEYADILCLTNLPCLKERRDSLCKKYFQNIMETTHRLNYLLPCQRCNQYDVRRFNKYPLPEIRTNRYRN